MLNYGLKKREIKKILKNKLSIDYSYDSGYILGSMCTDVHTFAKEIYCKYVSKNLGDPGLFPGTAGLEEETIAEIGELFNGENIIGSFTTGGSEANLIAMRIAKKLRPDIENPEVIVSKSAHMSFEKAADFLDLTLKKANLKDNFELDLKHFKSLINENTCSVIGIAGTTSLGLIDPIGEIGNLIHGKDIFFHVDAAFGGFVLPFLENLGYSIPSWDFSVDDVDSITADPHKMGLGIIPSGGYFLRDKKILQKNGFEIPYLAGGNFKHLQIVGTRSGGTVIAFWALMRYLGVKKFTKILRKCIENTKFLAENIRNMEGVKLVAEPIMNIVGITTENEEDVSQLDKNLRNLKWMLGKFKEFNLIRIIVMPHVTRAHISRFIKDLQKVVKKLKLV